MHEIYNAVNVLRLFLRKLMWQIKLMPEKEFAELLKNGELNFGQKVYLIYFRHL